MKGRKVFKTLVDPGLAVESLLSITGETLFRRLMEDTAIVRIEDSLGRLLASNVYSPIDLPYYPRSLVDGCAVRSIDTKHADESHPVSLIYSGLIHVGEKPSISVKPGSCVEVDTGAWIPLGADAVVPIEYVEIENSRAILTRSGGVWMNIALPSTDIGKGDLVASKGTLVTPQVASSIASVGIGEVRVTRRIRVSVGSTGDELVEPGSKLEEGKIFNSNRSYLITRLKELGADVLDHGIIRDDLEQITEALSKASDKSDIVVFTGGTSAGPEDVLYKAVEKIGKILFHGLKIKPGKPTIIGVINDKPFFGLPGNPRSAVNVFEKIVEKFLRELGLTLEPSCSSKELTLPVTIYGTRGRTTYIPVAIDGEYAWPVARDSYMIASYAWSDGLIEIPSNAYAPLTKGTKVRVAIKRKPVTTIYALTDVA
ncbi:MAG: molybdopterin molybdotransferase MoeA, partial [Desulfurococcales archaeon]|nr:molybdopterin molybdotransferase MoeA [Desulfurococcales archaeon]